MTRVSPNPAVGIDGGWAGLIDSVERLLQERALAANRLIVLVPYAQLMEAGRRAWAEAHPSGFSPRFESSRNWAAGLQPFLPGPTDISMDMARDSLVASALIDRVAPLRADAALRSVMVSRLVEAARQLAPLAAARPPAQRVAWAEALSAEVAAGLQALHWESLLSTLALTWASASAYATDVLWSDSARPGADADFLIVLQGFQEDPLTTALSALWGTASLALSLDPPQSVSAPGLHACDDAEDEAQRAAACVIERVNGGHAPVALVANDRLLTRRVSALLHRSGLAVRDETGWKLSTTHAAACVMSLLRAAPARASMDDILDWLKHARAWPQAQVSNLEQLARDAGVSNWQAAVQHERLSAALPVGLRELLDGLQASRSLTQWLRDLAEALVLSGLQPLLGTDPAGQQVLYALRLAEGAAEELDDVADALGPGGRSSARLSLSSFTVWVRDVLEGATFAPHNEPDAPVVILPLPQLLGRPFAAAVVPGCDEMHLSPSPDPAGDWTASQRERLGLPSRHVLAQAAASAWQCLLGLPAVDVLWRTQNRGEAVLPSAWVQSLLSASKCSPDPRSQRVLEMLAVSRPQPSAADVLPESLSASAYQDLRDCPYRFFALRQLRLVEAGELDGEPDQRDMGNWLHAVLRTFHERRGDGRPGRDADRVHLDQLADDTAAAMGLNAGAGGAGFLPYQAVWPALREGYLDWLSGFEATETRPGPRFALAEAALTSHAGAWRLFGKLDRIDVQHSPEGAIPFVIDYKTESRSKTNERVKDALEDTQLAFYAALLPDENLRAAYLSITDKRGDSGKDTPTWLIEQPDVLMAREQLRAGLARDMERVAAGQPMPALGEGRVCDFCAARGLCRKDFWTVE